MKTRLMDCQAAACYKQKCLEYLEAHRKLFHIGRRQLRWLMREAARREGTGDYVAPSIYIGVYEMDMAEETFTLDVTGLLGMVTGQVVFHPLKETVDSDDDVMDAEERTETMLRWADWLTCTPMDSAEADEFEGNLAEYAAGC